VLNKDRYQFAVKEVEFLGHMIAEAEAVPLISHMQTLRELQRPVDSEQLQRFLGLVSFYRRIIPDAAGILKPLSGARKGIKCGLLEWTPTMVSAFETAKAAMCNVT
jgi:hypothetical protein